ncbi:uncharacterized protein MTNAP1 [Halichoerus grypus]
MGESSRLTVKIEFVLPDSETAIVRRGDPRETTTKLAFFWRSSSKKVVSHPRSFVGKKLDCSQEFGTPDQTYNLQLVSDEALGSCPERAAALA